MVICLQITILILHQVISRLVAPLKFSYSSIQISDILVHTVHCKLINFAEWCLLGYYAVWLL
jgi:hypothetical protein